MTAAHSLPLARAEFVAELTQVLGGIELTPGRLLVAARAAAPAAARVHNNHEPTWIKLG